MSNYIKQGDKLKKSRSQVNSQSDEISSQYNEIIDLKSELNNLKEALKQAKEENAEQEKIHKLESEILMKKYDIILNSFYTNKYLYFRSSMCIKSFKIGLNMNQYLEQFDRIKSIDDIIKYKQYIINDDNEFYKVLNDILSDDLIKFMKENKTDFHHGGLNHYQLNNYIEEKLKSQVEKDKGEKYKSLLDEYSKKDKLYLYDDAGGLNNLMNSCQQVIGKITQTVERISKINLDDSDQLYTIRTDEDYYKNNYQNLSESVKSIVEDSKNFISVLRTIIEVASVTSMFESKYVGALKSMVYSLKAVKDFDDSNK